MKRINGFCKINMLFQKTNGVSTLSVKQSWLAFFSKVGDADPTPNPHLLPGLGTGIIPIRATGEL